MGSIRNLEVRLGQTIEDTINQKFGYREYSVTLPDGTSLEPRPEVTQQSLHRFNEAQIAVFIEKMGTGGIPSHMYQVMVSRAIPYDSVEQGGFWEIKRDDQLDPMNCIVLHIEYQDARYQVLLGVVKTDIG